MREGGRGRNGDTERGRESECQGGPEKEDIDRTRRYKQEYGERDKLWRVESR